MKLKLIKKKIIYGCEARGDYDSPYLTRWEFLSSSKFAVYLHKFHRSDDNSSLHDHPWNFITIPIWRGYNDCTYNGAIGGDGLPLFNRQRMYPLIPYYRKASHVHFVELINAKPAWTLIIRFKYIRWWGFWNKGVFTVFHEYFKKMGC
ncbi:hypothetical protein DIU36_24655 [Mucilaginibacter rubeus]|nr:hypothetical protein DIU36_24655 [Mucilaginibacter rubeus]